MGGLHLGKLFDKLLKGVVPAQLHFVGDIAHFRRKDLPEAPVFRVVRCDAQNLVGGHVGDLPPQLQIPLVGRVLALVSADYFFVLLWHFPLSLHFSTAALKYCAA